VSYAREGAKGIALVDILDEQTLAAGKAKVEAYGTKVSESCFVPASWRRNVNSGNVLQCITIRADVTKEADVERAIAETVKEFGRIDYAA
jgi:NAD(P)-dependent dehydrogenase (short-subunit alcohol dehydrogenase family)